MGIYNTRKEPLQKQKSTPRFDFHPVFGDKMGSYRATPLPINR
jgi:hypothetical protein